MNLEGKTIARVVDLDHDGQALVFTDGTAAHITGSGYEDSCASLEELTAMDVVRMEAELEDRRRGDAVTRERNIARRELKARIKRNVSPQAWQAWKRVHVSPMEDMADMLFEQMRHDMNRQSFGGFWTSTVVPGSIGRSAVIPVAKTSARRS